MNIEQVIKIMLVDDHSVYRRGLRDLLETEAGYQVVAEAGEGNAALRYASRIDIDVVLMDIELSSGIDGIDLTVKLNSVSPRPAVLMMSMHDSPQYVERAKQAGARGYVVKNESAETILFAIDEIVEGRFHWPPIKLNPKHKKPPTPRQMQVLKYIAQGLTNRQIARQLRMKERTVEAHRLNIRFEYNINTQPELVLFALDCMKHYGIPGDGP